VPNLEYKFKLDRDPPMGVIEEDESPDYLFDNLGSSEDD
jgi:hypothetical protein